MEQVQPLYAIIITILLVVVGGSVGALIKIFMSGNKKIVDEIDELKLAKNVLHDEIMNLKREHEVCASGVLKRVGDLEDDYDKVRSTQYAVNEKLTLQEIEIVKLKERK